MQHIEHILNWSKIGHLYSKKLKARLAVLLNQGPINCQIIQLLF